MENRDFNIWDDEYIIGWPACIWIYENDLYPRYTYLREKENKTNLETKEIEILCSGSFEDYNIFLKNHNLNIKTLQKTYTIRSVYNILQRKFSYSFYKLFIPRYKRGYVIFSEFKESLIKQLHKCKKLKSKKEKIIFSEDEEAALLAFFNFRGKISSSYDFAKTLFYAQILIEESRATNVSAMSLFNEIYNS